jgi:hypothetical protein
VVRRRSWGKGLSGPENRARLYGSRAESEKVGESRAKTKLGAAPKTKLGASPLRRSITKPSGPKTSLERVLFVTLEKRTKRPEEGE